MNVFAALSDAVIVAFGASLVAGIFAMIRLLYTIKTDIGNMKAEMVKSSYALDSVFTAFRYVLTATRYQNVALKQAGANGCTEQSDGFIDKAEKELDRRKASREDK